MAGPFEAGETGGDGGDHLRRRGHRANRWNRGQARRQIRREAFNTRGGLGRMETYARQDQGEDKGSVNG